MGLYCYFAVVSLLDIPGRINILRINLIDYLENHLANRLEQTDADMQSIAPADKAALDKHRAEPAAKETGSPAFSGPEIEELEKLLQELLT